MEIVAGSPARHVWARQLAVALDQLDPCDRAAVQCVYFLGSTRQDIAERYAVSADTVSRWLARGMSDLGALLRGSPVEVFDDPVPDIVGS